MEACELLLSCFQNLLVQMLYLIALVYCRTKGVQFSGSLEEAAVLGTSEEAVKLTCPQAGLVGLPANNGP